MADSWLSKASKLILHLLCKYITPREDKTQTVMLLQLSQHDVQGFSKHGPSQHMPAGSVVGYHFTARPKQSSQFSLLLGVGAGKHWALRGCSNEEHLGFGQFFLRIFGFLTFF